MAVLCGRNWERDVIAPLRMEAERRLMKAVEQDEIHANDLKNALCALERTGFTRETIEEDRFPDVFQAQLHELRIRHTRAKHEAKIKATQVLLNSPHMQCTLSAAINLWIVKFGDGWVPKQQVAGAADEMNWQALGRRLAEARRMEEYDDFWRVIT